MLSNAGSGPISTVIDGLNWVLQQALNEKGRPKVCNLSLGGSFSPMLNKAVETLVQDGGVFTAVAAGNDNALACLTSPASASSSSDVVSVGATDSIDQRASFSNFGSCVAIFGAFASFLLLRMSQSTLASCALIADPN